MITDSYSGNFNSQNGFDRQETCQPKGVSSKSGDRENLESTVGATRQKSERSECCGDGIQRAPFKPSIFECCEDGQIEAIGEC